MDPKLKVLYKLTTTNISHGHNWVGLVGGFVGGLVGSLVGGFVGGFESDFVGDPVNGFVGESFTELYPRYEGT